MMNRDPRVTWCDVCVWAMFIVAALVLMLAPGFAFPIVRYLARHP